VTLPSVLPSGRIVYRIARGAVLADRPLLVPVLHHGPHRGARHPRAGARLGADG
jgi:hypothetical protein